MNRVILTIVAVLGVMALESVAGTLLLGIGLTGG